MTRDRHLLSLLSDIESALKDYSYALSTARRPALSAEEMLAIVRASKSYWQRLEAARQTLEDSAANRPEPTP
ncbi:hypothetical protein GCM10028812_53530 [Ancylobacter sonchi]